MTRIMDIRKSMVDQLPEYIIAHLDFYGIFDVKKTFRSRRVKRNLIERYDERIYKYSIMSN